MPRPQVARRVLIFSLAFVFLYFGIDKFAHPLIWIGWLPIWMDGLFGLSKDSWLQCIAVIEVLLGIALLVPIRSIQRLGAAFGALHLLGILTQTGWNDIAIRDIGLLGSLIALLSL